MTHHIKASAYASVPEERWKTWETKELKANNAIWDAAPGYDLIPEVDLPMFHSLFLDGTHSSPPVTPLYGYMWVRHCGLGTKWVNISLSLPTCYGWEWRYLNGGLYVAFLVVRDPEERRQREEKFRAAIVPYLEDFEGIWNRGKETLNKVYDHLKAFDPEKASPLDFWRHNWELDEAYQKMWEIHFFGMQTSYSAWILLEEECKKRFGMNDQSPEFQDMMRGFENELYKIDKELWLLSKEAVEMGLSDTFKSYGPEVLLEKLEEGQKGKEWSRHFKDFLNIYGWRMVRMNDLVDPYWLERPSIPLKIIKDHVTTGIASMEEYPLDKKRRELAQRRDQAVKNLLDRVPPQDRDWFSSLIRLAQYASVYSEEHDLYCELTCQALMRRGYLAIGKRLAGEGCIDQPEDVFMMNPWEIESAILLPSLNDFRWITRRRRREWEGWVNRFVQEGEWRPPLYTDRPGGLPEAVEKDLLPSLDPICVKIIIGELPAPKEGLKADIIGLCGSPGVVEGKARIIINYEDLDQLQPGEILVCPGTNPAWTPAFNIAGGVIADRGGTLSHTAIIGREYGLPVVVNTFTACQTIKTGQKIKLDATNGAVYILD